MTTRITKLEHRIAVATQDEVKELYLTLYNRGTDVQKEFATRWLIAHGYVCPLCMQLLGPGAEPCQ
jgi:hypothetical protein